MADLCESATSPVGQGASKTSGPVLTVLLTSVAYFMVTLDALVVVTALPSIHRDLGGGIATLQWTVSAYTMAFGAGIITAAALGDRLGRRRVYVVGLGLFTLASAACALAPNAEVLIACRAIQGLGAAIVMPLGLTLLTSAFPPEKRGVVVGIWGGIAGLAVASGPLIGGALTQGLSWHWIFWVNVPIGALAFVGAGASAGELGAEESVRHPRPRSGHRGGRPHLGTGARRPEGLGKHRERGRPDGGDTPDRRLHRARGTELRTDDPPPAVPDDRLFFRRGHPVPHGRGHLLGGLSHQPVLPVRAGGLPVRRRAPLPAVDGDSAVDRPPRRALSDRVGSRALVVPGLVMQGIGFAWIVWLAASSSGYASYVPPFVIAGVGISMALPCVTAAGLNAVPPELLGKAAGTLNTMQQFGAVFGVAVVTAVFNSKGSLTDAASVTSGYRPALAVSAGISILGAVVAIGMRRAPRTLAAEPSAQRRPTSTQASENPASELVPAFTSD